LAICDEKHIVSRALAQQVAQQIGLTSAALDEWLSQAPLKQLGEDLVLWTGTVADKAEVVLSVLGRPATTEEVNDVIGESHNVRSLRNRLLGDPRFLRTDRSRVGLREWGLEEYSGIVEEIEEELERSGETSLPLPELSEILAARFQVRSTSVLSYASVPRFVIEMDRVRLRRPDEPYIPGRTLWQEPGAFQLDADRCSYRWRVDAELLRGSGRSLPPGVGAWLGVLPTMRRSFEFADGDTLLVSWPDSALFGPSVGSLRRQALVAEATEGDYLRVVFNRVTDVAVGEVVRQADLRSLEGWRRGAVLVGIAATEECDYEDQLQQGVGVSSRSELRKVLLKRRELELAGAGSHDDSPELDDAFDRLREVL
jgi:hypothetical protein